MSRDLEEYQRSYLLQPYEKYQVSFRKRKIKELLSKYAHNNLLEVGCGLESIFHSIYSYDHLTIIEPAEIFYTKALSEAKLVKNNNIAIINSELEKADFKNTTFNFIIISSLLHEIENQNNFLKKLHQISSNNTVLHLNVPNAKSFHRLLAVQMGLIKSEFEMSAANKEFQQQQVFDLETLINLVESHGFKIIESGSYCFKPFTHQQMQNMLDAKLLTNEMLDGLYNMTKYLPNFGSEVFVNFKKI